MNTKEMNERRNRRNEQLQEKISGVIETSLLPREDGKYAVLKELRLKLGKSEEEFKKIFDLYFNLLSQKNT
jgi:hypothetical protein